MVDMVLADHFLQPLTIEQAEETWLAAEHELEQAQNGDTVS